MRIDQKGQIFFKKNSLLRCHRNFLGWTFSKKDVQTINSEFHASLLGKLRPTTSSKKERSKAMELHRKQSTLSQLPSSPDLAASDRLPVFSLSSHEEASQLCLEATKKRKSQSGKSLKNLQSTVLVTESWHTSQTIGEMRVTILIRGCVEKLQS